MGSIQNKSVMKGENKFGFINFMLTVFFIASCYFISGIARRANQK